MNVFMESHFAPTIVPSWPASTDLDTLVLNSNSFTRLSYQPLVPTPPMHVRVGDGAFPYPLKYEGST